MSTQNRGFILVLLLIHYCAIFHSNDWEPTLPHLVFKKETDNSTQTLGEILPCGALGHPSVHAHSFHELHSPHPFFGKESSGPGFVQRNSIPN